MANGPITTDVKAEQTFTKVRGVDYDTATDSMRGFVSEQPRPKAAPVSPYTESMAGVPAFQPRS